MHVGFNYDSDLGESEEQKIKNERGWSCKRCSQLATCHKNSGPWLRYFGDLHDYLPHYLQHFSTSPHRCQFFPIEEHVRQFEGSTTIDSN